MKIAIVFGVVAFATSVVASEDFLGKIEEEWNLFKSTYNKSYGGADEDVLRKKIYLENKLEIIRHNERYENGEVSYTLGMNHFGDLTGEEFLERMNEFEPSLDDMDTNNTFVRFENINYPDNLNWVAKGYVTPVKDQGHCGGCWSFSTTGSLEGQHFKKTGRLVSFSEQNLMDCSWSYGNKGCNGGNTYNALKYIRDNDGIDTEDSYPYTGKSGQCRYSRRNRGATVSDARKVDAGDGNLLAAVATVGPVAVSVEVIRSFQLYKHGVYSDDSCGVRHNHAVLAVGYGVTRDGAAKYWTLKNSWNTDWGTDGYMFMTRDVPNMCGVSDNGVYPVV